MKYLGYIVFMSFLVSFVACKPDGSSSDKMEDKDVNNMTEAEALAYEQEMDRKQQVEDEKRRAENKIKDNGIPNPCVMISKQQISSLFDVEPDAINIKSGSSPTSKNTKSCFFRWSTPESPNTGMLIQLMTNPVADEVEDWPTKFVESKITDGDNSFDGSGTVYKYKRFDGVGDAGAYNYDSGKYVWRLGNDMIYTVAFNITEKEDKQVEQVRKIADIIMSSDR